MRMIVVIENIFIFSRRRFSMQKKVSYKILSLAVVFSMGFILQNLLAVQTADINLENGVKIAEELAKNMARELEELSRKRERELRSIENDIKELDRSFNQGEINQLSYQNQRNDLIEKKNRQNTSYDNAEKIVNKTFNGGIDLGLKFMHNKLDEQKDKQKLKEIAVEQEFKNRGNLAIARDNMKQIIEAFKDPENLKLYLKYGLLFVGGTVGLYYGGKFAYKYFESQLGLPTLVRESSRAGFSFWDMFDFFSDNEDKETPEDRLNNIILDPKLEKRIRQLAITTKSAKEKELPYQHTMLYGKPGTGKTMFARILASYSGMDYAIMSGADFAQFDEGKDIEELHKLFDWAESTEGGLLVFIDEAEAFLRKRSLSDVRTIRLLDAFLSRTGTSSNKIMFVFATNHPEMMDPAVLSRISEQVHFPLPGPTEREAILKLYLHKYIDEDRRMIKKAGQQMEAQLFIEKSINDDYIKSVAQTMKGIAGREIEQMVQKMRQIVYLTDDLTLTKELFDDIVFEALARQKARKQFQDGIGILYTAHEE